MSTTRIPLAARAADTPPLVHTTVENVTWDADRQINVRSDGTPWHTAPQAASCTDTNQDGKGDDVDDPYFAPAT
ncbi:hypothetical protein [Streptomyces sp. NPDC005438]|uniref:hypothetical protein n=1 Tax=Streptomyces sp. NPDC005438 TaxID=3156880 RepID=UPI0033A873EB